MNYIYIGVCVYVSLAFVCWYFVALLELGFTCNTFGNCYDQQIYHIRLLGWRPNQFKKFLISHNILMWGLFLINRGTFRKGICCDKYKSTKHRTCVYTLDNGLCLGRVETTFFKFVNTTFVNIRNILWVCVYFCPLKSCL